MYIKKRKRNTLFSKQFKRKGENLLISKKFERTDDPDLGGFKNEFTSLLGFFLWYWPFQNHLNLVISNIWCNHVIIFFFLNVSLVSFHQMWQGFYPPSFFRGVGRNGIGVSLSLSRRPVSGNEKPFDSPFPFSLSLPPPYQGDVALKGDFRF